MDFRTLGVLYETPQRKLSIMFEEAANSKGSWIAIGDLSHWHTGEPVSDSDGKKIIGDLNDWGRAQGWRFDVGAKNIRIEDIPPEHRKLFLIVQEAQRRREEERKNIYGQK
jgi:hypothetical protein